MAGPGEVGSAGAALFRWRPGMTNSYGERIMPCGLTASELEDLTADMEHQILLQQVPELQFARRLPPLERHAMAGSEQLLGNQLEAAAEVLTQEPATPSHMERCRSLGRSTNPSFHGGSTANASCSTATLDPRPISCGAAPARGDTAASSAVQCSAAASSAHSHVRSSSVNRKESGQCVFENVNRVAAVAGSEYVKQRSGDRSKRKVEEPCRSAGWHLRESFEPGQRSGDASLVVARQPWQHALQLTLAGVTITEHPVRAPDREAGGATEGQCDGGGGVAPWLATSSVSSSMGPDAAGQQPPSPTRRLQGRAAAVPAVVTAKFGPAPPPPAPGMHDSADRHLSLLLPPAARGGSSVVVQTVVPQPPSTFPTPPSSSLGRPPESGDEGTSDSSTSSGKSPHGKSKACGTFFLRPIAALSRLLRF